MSTSSIISMTIILTIVVGGFITLLIKAIKNEKNKKKSNE